jgi:CDP-diacylglycerol---glycerol-3-phosphate 3-phosphatidyltransferase
MGYKDVRDSIKNLGQKILAPLLVLLHKAGVTPNIITWVGFLLLLPAVYCLAKGMFFPAALIIIFSSLFDMLDGALARKTGQKTKFGGFLDSTVDRFSEGVLYLGLLIFYSGTNNINGVILSYLTLFFSFLVSYIRARAGGLKIDCEIGIFTRPERLIALIIGLLINRVYEIMLVISAVSFITVIQRMWLVYNEAKKLDKIKK